MSNPVELVIFDCDGVLVDSERLAVRIDVQVLAALGWALTEQEVIERFVGRPDEVMVAEIEAYLGRALPKNWEDPFHHLYRDAFASALTPVAGIVEALDQITLPTCVASSGTHERMRYTLGLTGLYDRFAGRIFSSSEVARGKPAPDIFLKAAQKLNVDPTDCLVFEDAVSGVVAAKSAGMTCIAITTTHPEADLHRADLVINSFEHLQFPTLLQSLRIEH